MIDGGEVVQIVASGVAVAYSQTDHNIFTW